MVDGSRGREDGGGGSESVRSPAESNEVDEESVLIAINKS